MKPKNYKLPADAYEPIIKTPVKTPEVIEDADKGFVPSTNLILGRLKMTPEDDHFQVVQLTKYEHGRRGIRNLIAEMKQQYEKQRAQTTVDISDLDVASDKQL